MTYAPGDLKNVRNWLLSALNMHPGNVAADLEPDEVGICGDPAHASTGGYHEGNDDLNRVGRITSDYSKRESGRDRPGTNAASALDIGMFNARGWTLRSLSLALADACGRGDPRTRDVRELIFSPDGRTVRRWDRLGIRTTGDDSHLSHSHLSFFRDSEGRRDHPDNILGLLQELIGGQARTESTTAPTTTPGEAMQMLVRFNDATNPQQVWLCDGMTRRPITAAQLAAVGNAQTHQAGLLGLLANGGNVFVSGGDPDVWGVDIVQRIADATGAIHTTLTDAQVTALATQVSTALAAAPDVPLGDADKPAIEAALRDVLRTGVGT